MPSDKPQTTDHPPDDDKKIIVDALHKGLPESLYERSLVWNALNRLTVGAWRYEEMKSNV